MPIWKTPRKASPPHPARVGHPCQRNGMDTSERDDVAEKDGFQRRAVLLRAEGHHGPGEEDPAHDGQEVSLHAAEGELVHEEQHHAAEHHGDGHPVQRRCLLLEEDPAERGRLERRRVLQQDRVGRGGELVGRDEPDHAGRVADRARDLGEGPREARPADGRRGSRAPPMRLRIPAMAKGFQETILMNSPPRAPQEGAGGHRRDGDALPARGA